MIWAVIGAATFSTGILIDALVTTRFDERHAYGMFMSFIAFLVGYCSARYWTRR